MTALPSPAENAKQEVDSDPQFDDMFSLHVSFTPIEELIPCVLLALQV